MPKLLLLDFVPAEARDQVGVHVKFGISAICEEERITWRKEERKSKEKKA